MIRFKNKTFEQWSICPATGDIFDAKTGEVQPVKIWRGRLYFRGKLVHQIMVHTFFGYKSGHDVHHKDENPLNNSLSNLLYLTHSEHRSLHATELLHEETRLKISASMIGKNKGKNKGKKLKPLSAEHKAKISASMKGKNIGPKSEETRLKMSAAKKGKNKGKPRSAETRLKISEAMRRNRANTSLKQI